MNKYLYNVRRILHRCGEDIPYRTSAAKVASEIEPPPVQVPTKLTYGLGAMWKHRFFLDQQTLREMKQESMRQLLLQL
jgi:hypothetical protein